MSKLLAVAALVVAAGAAGWFLARGSEHAVSLGQPPAEATIVQATQPTGTLPSSRSFSVWFTRGGRLVEALRTHRPTPAVASAALEALLSGPTQAERAAGIETAIPKGTRLGGIAIEHGVVRVDLTSAYEEGAGSRSQQLRLAQVVYTATQFPSVKAVRFSVDGAPVNVFSGSGVVLSHAVGRDAYRGLAPAASPLAGSWRTLPTAPVGALGSRSSAWTGRELLILEHGALVAYAPGTNTWKRLPGPPGLHGSIRTVWTGRELIAWGSSALAYSPSTRRWRTLPRPPFAGPPRVLAWTGRELLGWAGSRGASYRPATNKWHPLAGAPLTGPAAWTGRELIVVSGGRAAGFRPERGWRRLPALPEARPGAGAVWDGSELLVVGGDGAPTVGLAYSPAAQAWRRLAPMDSGRTHAVAVWTGSRLLLWGGETGRPGAFVIPPHGLAYDPKADRWSPLPQAPLRGRLDPVGAWTGRSLLVWGGDPGFADGAVFTPTAHSRP